MVGCPLDARDGQGKLYCEDSDNDDPGYRKPRWDESWREGMRPSEVKKAVEEAAANGKAKQGHFAVTAGSDSCRAATEKQGGRKEAEAVSSRSRCCEYSCSLPWLLCVCPGPCGARQKRAHPPCHGRKKIHLPKSPTIHCSIRLYVRLYALNIVGEEKIVLARAGVALARKVVGVR